MPVGALKFFPFLVLRLVAVVHEIIPYSLAFEPVFPSLNIFVLFENLRLFHDRLRAGTCFTHTHVGETSR